MTEVIYYGTVNNGIEAHVNNKTWVPVIGAIKDRGFIETSEVIDKLNKAVIGRAVAPFNVYYLNTRTRIYATHDGQAEAFACLILRTTPKAVKAFPAK